MLNQGDNTNTTNPQSGIAAIIITTPYQLSPIANGGQTRHRRRPQCMLEDPSNQFVYTANAYSRRLPASSITELGRSNP